MKLESHTKDRLTWNVAPITVADFSPTPIALKRAWNRMQTPKWAMDSNTKG